MQRRDFLREFLVAGSTGAAIITGGCGTILHHERIHQPHSRDIDWKVAGMNGLGLALFFVPGVVAFVVDFYTGAIYLPPARTPGYAVATEPATGSEVPEPGPFVSWHRISVPPAALRQATIQRALSDHLGELVSLSESDVRISRLTRWSQYRHQLQQHLRDDQYGATPQTFFADVG